MPGLVSYLNYCVGHLGYMEPRQGAWVLSITAQRKARTPGFPPSSRRHGAHLAKVPAAQHSQELEVIQGQRCLPGSRDQVNLGPGAPSRGPCSDSPQPLRSTSSQHLSPSTSAPTFQHCPELSSTPRVLGWGRPGPLPIQLGAGGTKLGARAFCALLDCTYLGGFPRGLDQDMRGH